MNSSLNPITEDDIAQFLIHTPDFFERHAELLATVQLTSPHGKRAVSLQERQAELLREKIRGLELKAAGMIRHGQANTITAERLHDWTLILLQTADAQVLPQTIAQTLRELFDVPQVALRVWGTAPEFLGAPHVMQPEGDDLDFASSMITPYCGPNPGLDVVRWLDVPEAAHSVAVVPLREAPTEPVFGVLVMGSDDPMRFTPDMGTDFLRRMAELASAALLRLRAATD